MEIMLVNISIGVIKLGRKKQYRQKRHEQVHSLESKSLFGHLVTELMQTQGVSQKEAEK